MALYDAEGNEIEGALSPEEAKELQEKVSAAEEAEQKVAELEEKMKEKEEALNKLSDKDHNFKALREKTEEEVAEMKKKMSDRQQELLDEVLSTRRELDSEKEARRSEAEKEILDSLAGGDDELRKAIKLAESELVGEAKTPSEMEQRYRKAFILAKGEAPRPSPIFSGYSSSYSEPDTKPKRFTETEQGKASLQKWFGKDVASKVLGEEKK